MKLCEALRDFVHDYDDQDAVVFTLGTGVKRSVGHEMVDAFLKHPTACLPLTQADFGVVAIRKKRTLSTQVLERKKERYKKWDEEKAFWRYELARARPKKFLSLLEQEKAAYHGVFTSRQRTQIYVEYNGKRLPIGCFEWIAGDRNPYISFRKERVR